MFDIAHDLFIALENLRSGGEAIIIKWKKAVCMTNLIIPKEIRLSLAIEIDNDSEMIINFLKDRV